MTMKAHELGAKRFAKKLKRKNKKYAGPKYSRLEQMLVFYPLLEKAGIVKPIENVEQDQPIVGKHHNVEQDGSGTTSFV